MVCAGGTIGHEPETEIRRFGYIAAPSLASRRGQCSIPAGLLAMSSDAKNLNAIALDPQRSVVIEACAGSGKTWLLVSRIVRLLLAGARPSDILAITFTRKAAQEMAVRLREWLYRLATASDDEVRQFLREREVPPSQIDTLLPRARGIYEIFLTAQPAITITTFHSWFMQLLRRAPLDAGVAGDTALVEQTATLVSDAWQRYANGLAREPDGVSACALDELFERIGLENTRGLLRNFMHRRADWWAATADAAAGKAVESQLDKLRTEFGVDAEGDPCAELLADQHFLSQLHDYQTLLTKGTATEQKAASTLSAAWDGNGQRDCFRALCKVLLTNSNTPRAKKPGKAQRERFGADGANGAADEARYLQLHEQLCARTMGVLEKLSDIEAYAFNAAALTCGAALLDAYQAVKRERQVIDYGDIEWRVYQLLVSGEHAAYLQTKLDARYRHILLDEFQDTNPLQWLTLKAWFAAAAEAGSTPTVFLVGDPKQSIYRFRRAESRLFAYAASDLEVMFDAARLSQDESRRCAGPVIDLVNAVFSQPEANYPGFAVHTAHNSTTPGRIEVLPLAANDAAGESDKLAALRNPLHMPLEVAEDRRRVREAEALVSGITRVVGRWQIADDAAGTVRRVRPARYADIMVLVRRRTHLTVYERALRHAGIPYVTSRQGGLLDTLEARDITALLEFLIAPFSNLKLAHALRSPVFDCNDEDLMALAACGAGTWWERVCDLATGVSCSVAMRRAHRLLTHWLANVGALPVHDQLDRIYFEADVLCRFEAAVAPAARGAVRANLLAYIQRALDSDAGRYPSLPKFINEINELRNGAAEEAPDEGIIGDSADAVRILTVHGAKGLEAPVVWLLDTTATQPARGYDALIDWPPDTTAPAHFSLWSKRDELSRAQRVHHTHEEEIAAREDLNLLYVATTRARQALIISGSQKSGSAETWYTRLRRAIAQLTGIREDGGTILAYGSDMSLTTSSPARWPEAEVLAQAAPYMTQPMPTGKRTAALTSAGQRAAMGYGTQFHLVMDRLTRDSAGREGNAPDVDALRRELALPREAFEALWRDAQRLLNTVEYRRYFDTGWYISAANEMPMVTTSGEILRIDRLVEFAESVSVLDYKTGQRDTTDAVLLADYKKQVAAYCRCVSKAFPGRPVEGLIIFAGGGSVTIPASV